MRRVITLFTSLILVSISICLPLTVCRAHGDVAAEPGPDADVKQFRFSNLEARLRAIPPGPEHNYFAGVLANAENHVSESIQLLTNALPSLRISRTDRAAIALQVLADDYTKSFQYGKAARTDDDLLSNFASRLTPEQRKGTKDDAEVMRILRDAPAQTITWDGPVKLKTERNPINSLDTDLTVNGVQGRWLLDTGANLSLVTKSFAERLGLKPLPGVAHTRQD